MKKQFNSLWRQALLCLAVGLFVSCTPKDLTPPTLSITSPAPNSPVSGTVAVLVNAVAVKTQIIIQASAII